MQMYQFCLLYTSFGYYGDLIREILKSLGYKFKYLHIDFSRMTYSEIIKEICSVTKGVSKIKVFWAIVLALYTVFYIDSLYQKANYVRCRDCLLYTSRCV